MLSTAAIMGLAAACGGNYTPSDAKLPDTPTQGQGDDTDKGNNQGDNTDPSGSTLADLLANAKDYNILFITSDEHNAQMVGYERDKLGFSTDIQTPNLDKLAREGEYFTHAYAACPLCAPTRQSIYTGLYPLEHGEFNANAVFPNQPTWGDFFSARGYYTGVIGKTHDNNPPLTLGFDYVIKQSGDAASDAANVDSRLVPDPGLGKPTVPAIDKPYYDAAALLPQNDGQLRGAVLQNVLQDRDGIVTKLVQEFLQTNKDRKFFLHASLVAPHWPWNAPNDFYYMYNPATIQMPESSGPPPSWDIQPLNVYTTDDWSQIDDGMTRVFRARYMGALSWMDDNVGQILKTLDDLGLGQKTIVIYTSDHGDMAGEKGMWFKMVMYEQSVRVPLIIRMPGVITPGTVNDTLINHVDYFPTLAGLSGNAEYIPDTLTGHDLTGAVLGLSPGPEYTISVRSTNGLAVLPSVHMVRSKQYKLVRYNANNFVMYDIDHDRYETTNIINTAPADVVAAHKKALNDYITYITPRWK